MPARKRHVGRVLANRANRPARRFRKAREKRPGEIALAYNPGHVH